MSSFPRERVCDICDRPCLPSSWLGSDGDYSPGVLAAPFLRALRVRVIYFMTCGLQPISSSCVLL
jgi:hypothetical protein